MLRGTVIITDLKKKRRCWKGMGDQLLQKTKFFKQTAPKNAALEEL
jgi:hypothetical protein